MGQQISGLMGAGQATAAESASSSSSSSSEMVPASAASAAAVHDVGAAPVGLLSSVKKWFSGVTWYAAPKQSITWKEASSENPETRHVEWGDLFFDLVFVAATFKLGLVLTYDLVPSHDYYNVKTGVFDFCALIIQFFMAWNIRTQFSARFETNDFFHAALHSAQTFAIAIAVMFIPSKVDAQGHDMGYQFRHDPLFARGISAALLIYHVLVGVAYFEVWRVLDIPLNSSNYSGSSKWRRDEKDHRTNWIKESTEGAKFLGGIQVCIALMFVVCYGVTLVRTSLTNKINTDGEYDFSIFVSWTWLLAFVILNGWNLFFACYLAMKDKAEVHKYDVALDVKFLIHRFGEWTMLILGESFLSLTTIVDVKKGMAIVLFCISICTIFILFYSVVNVLKERPSVNLFNRSRVATSCHVIMVTFVLPLSLVMSAIGAKSLLSLFNMELSSDDHPAISMYCYSVAAFFFFVSMMSVLHEMSFTKFCGIIGKATSNKCTVGHFVLKILCVIFLSALPSCFLSTFKTMAWVLFFSFVHAVGSAIENPENLHGIVHGIVHGHKV